MKYVKTFENFSQEMTQTQTQGQVEQEVVDINSPEVQQALANIAKEEGLDPEEVVDNAVEVASEVKTNEEEEPFSLSLIAAGVAGMVALFGAAFGSVKLSQNSSLKRYVQFKAEQEVKDAIQKDPSLINKGYEGLVKTAYNNLMANKEFIDKAKNLGGGWPSHTVQGLDKRYRGFSPTAGQL
jgi:hypothetical protein